MNFIQLNHGKIFEWKSNESVGIHIGSYSEILHCLLSYSLVSVNKQQFLFNRANCTDLYILVSHETDSTIFIINPKKLLKRDLYHV